ncbi:MAG: tetratricopeptide repeat protein [Gemmatimonadaceae bacterium]
MTTPAQRSARLELDSARPAVARMDGSRGGEDTAADLLETWVAVEAALRALVGSTVLSGQPLIREARQRQLINFDQANSLAEFQAVRDRVQSPAYRPTESDVAAAHGAFLKLDTALMTDMTAEPTKVIAPPGSASPSASGPIRTGSPGGAGVAPDAGPVAVVEPPRRFPIWLLVTAGVVVVSVVLLVFLRPFGGGTTALQEGIDAYRGGQREAAVNAFNRAVRDDKTAVPPHVYLARMAREVGNFTVANQELQTALELDPTDATALREMGANLLAQGNLELSRRFYVRAVEADPTDKTAQGYLGCVLMKLNRVPEGTSFVNRAGPGPWSNCAPVPPAGSAGQAPKAVPRH